MLKEQSRELSSFAQRAKRGAEQFSSNRKEEVGDRVSSGVVVLNQEEKEVNLALL